MSAINAAKVDDISEISHVCHFTLTAHWHFNMSESLLTLPPLLLLLLMISVDDATVSTIDAVWYASQDPVVMNPLPYVICSLAAASAFRCSQSILQFLLAQDWSTAWWWWWWWRCWWHHKQELISVTKQLAWHLRIVENGAFRPLHRLCIDVIMIIWTKVKTKSLLLGNYQIGNK